MKNNEEWRPIVGFEGKYEVSNLARVRSLERTHTFIRHEKNKKFSVTRIVKAKILRLSIPKKGYPTASLWTDNKGTNIRVHILVLTSFIGPCPPSMECRHLDGNKSNSVLLNIKWGTLQENAADRTKHGHHAIGEHVKNSKLKVTDIYKIRSQLGSRSHGEIAKDFGVARRTISNISRGERWGHVR